MPSQSVRDYYDAEGEEEWRRLEKDPYHRLELLTHLRFLEKFLPARGTILDAGGGPGRYAIDLARKAYRVVLFDFSPVQLDIARRKASEAAVPAGRIEFVEGALPDLSRFPAGAFDAVICFGALSHLIDAADRDRAIAELVRVARDRAPLFVSVINRLGVIRVLLQRPELHPEFVDPDHRSVLETGIHRGHPGRGPGRFPDAYFFTPDELRKSLEGRGVETLAMAGCEGLASHLQEPLATLAQDERLWDRWMEIHWQTCEDPAAMGVAEHVLFVGRKGRGPRSK